MVTNNSEVKEELRRILTPERFKHSVGVAEAAVKLAVHNGVDEEKAYLAGLVHDCAKELSRAYQLVLAMKAKTGFDLSQLPYPFLYHGPAGSVYGRTHFAIQDEEILKAISLHILGDVDMSSLEKIVFVADYIEENRKFSWREKIWKAAFENLDKAVVLGCETTIHYLTSNQKIVHPKMIKTKDYYDRKFKEEILC